VNLVVCGGEVSHLARGEQRHSTLPGELGDPADSPPAARRPVVGQLDVEVLPETLPKRPQHLACLPPPPREDEAGEVAERHRPGQADEPPDVLEHGRERAYRLAPLLGAAPVACEEPAQRAVALHRLG
jgi:hypothetical protein